MFRAVCAFEKCIVMFNQRKDHILRCLMAFLKMKVWEKSIGIIQYYQQSSLLAETF